MRNDSIVLFILYDTKARTCGQSSVGRHTFPPGDARKVEDDTSLKYGSDEILITSVTK